MLLYLVNNLLITVLIFQKYSKGSYALVFIIIIFWGYDMLFLYLKLVFYNTADRGREREREKGSLSRLSLYYVVPRVYRDKDEHG